MKSYLDCPNKRIVQSIIAPYIHNPYIGLAGSHPAIYIHLQALNGLKAHALYENSSVLLNTPNLISFKSCPIIPKDVYMADYKPDSYFYDLDFTGNASTYKKYIKKFIRNVAFTFSPRTRGGEYKNILDFLYIRKEGHLYDNLPDWQHNIGYSYMELGLKYKIFKYFDTVSMVTILCH